MACASSTDDCGTASAHMMNPNAPAYCPSYATHDEFQTCTLSDATFELSVLCVPVDSFSFCHGGAEPLQHMNPDAPVFCPSDMSLDNLFHTYDDYIDPSIEVSFLCIAMDGTACNASTPGAAHSMNPNAPEFCPSDTSSDVLLTCGSTATFESMDTEYLTDYTQSCSMSSELHKAGLIEHGLPTYFLPDGILDNFDDPLDNRSRARRNEHIQDTAHSRERSTPTTVLRQVCLEVSLRCWRPAWHQTIFPNDCMRLLLFVRRQFKEWSTQCDGELVRRRGGARLDHKLHIICTKHTNAFEAATSSSQGLVVKGKSFGQFGQSHSHRTTAAASAGASRCHHRNGASRYSRTRAKLAWWHSKQSAQHDPRALAVCASIPRFFSHKHFRPEHKPDLGSGRTLARNKSIHASTAPMYVVPKRMQLSRILRNVVCLCVLLFWMLVCVCRHGVRSICASL